VAETPWCDTETLEFNATNEQALINCTQFNYRCPAAGDRLQLEQIDTTEAVPANCSDWSYFLVLDGDYNGSLSLPGIVSAAGVHIQGEPGLTEAIPLNLTGLDLSDLVNIATSGLRIEYADKVQDLNVPKLTNTGLVWIDVTGVAPPPINLSFPSLYDGGGGIYLYGNIDQ
jgi:hypothetical protein